MASSTLRKSSMRNCFQQIFLKPLLIIVTFILALILSPIVILVTLPIYVARFWVSVASKCCSPDLGKMLTTRSAIFGVDDIYTQPLCINACKLVLEGQCDLQSLTKVIEDTWLNARVEEEGSSQPGQLKYPELKQFVTVWCGFLFWMNDRNFNIGNHVKFYERKKPGNFILDSEVKEVWNELSMKPFQKDKSPWEIIILPFYRDHHYQHQQSEELSKSVLIFRWHHSMSDGFSILKLFTSVANVNLNTVAKVKTNLNPQNCCNKLWQKVCVFFTTPYIVLATLLTSSDSNAWHLSEDKLTRYWHLGATDTKIPITIVHDIKNSCSVSFSTVILAAVTGGMRKFMQHDIDVNNRQGVIPKNISVGFPLPLPNHPEKLRNHWAMCIVSLPVSEANPFKRLQIIEKRLKELKASSKPLISHVLAPLVGGLLFSMIKIIAKNRLPTLVCSIMPGPSEQIKNFAGCPIVEDIMYIVGNGPGNSGFSFSAFSYAGEIKFAVTVDSAFSPNEEISQNLIMNMSEELDFLKQSAGKPVHVV